MRFVVIVYVLAFSFSVINWYQKPLACPTITDNRLTHDGMTFIEYGGKGEGVSNPNAVTMHRFFDSAESDTLLEIITTKGKRCVMEVHRKS